MKFIFCLILAFGTFAVGQQSAPAMQSTAAPAQPTAPAGQNKSAAQPPLVDIPKNIRPYYVAFLELPEGAKREEPPMDLVRQHLAYIRKQSEAKKYVVAGPMTHPGKILGLIIVDAQSADEARELVEGDPMVKSGKVIVKIAQAMYAEIIPNAKY